MSTPQPCPDAEARCLLQVSSDSLCRKFTSPRLTSPPLRVASLPGKGVNVLSCHSLPPPDRLSSD